MFFDIDIVGNRLPPGSLCLTYDDGPGRTEGGNGGPGPSTAELGAFLHSRGIAATFFAVGKFAAGSGDILAGLRALGHLVANHTFDHPSLPAFVARGGDAQDQLAKTDEAIRYHVDGPVTLFRAPYGDWRLKGQTRSNVAADLNQSPLARSHVGPVRWDIDAGDVGYWRDNRPAEECAQAYLHAIEQAERGIVLMHDSTADIDEIRPRNRALGLARALVPELQRRGYRFVRLDAIPQVASAARVSALWTLGGGDGSYLSAPPDRGNLAFVSAASIPPGAILGAVPLGTHRWALRAPNGLYLSPQPGGGVIANARSIGEREILTLEEYADDWITLRTVDGSYLTQGRDDTSLLKSDAATPGESAMFRRPELC